MSVLVEDDDTVYYNPLQNQQQQQQQQLQPHQQPLDLDNYRQCLQWLQQTCRPVFMKELTDLSYVPVPITADNAKHPDMIGGSQHVQVASWKQTQVQVMPADRWGGPAEVLQEVSRKNEEALLLSNSSIHPPAHTILRRQE